ncbi:MAG: flagellar basal body L-ring protein FlgH [Burkholderiales bacterium]|nr:flagellar basal body L-ring protein FlgH [Burkholderiales bacterium]
MNTRLLLAPLLAVASLAGGCVALQRVPQVDVVPSPALPAAAVAAPAAQPPAPVPTGAIFQADRYRPLVEDHRARLVGDTIVVQITEKVSATQKATSSVDKSGETDFSITALPGVRAARLARMGAAGSNSNTFEGKGVTESSNDFSGTITATVVQVLPNGHMVIAGEKQIGVNANVDVLRFSGQVDPRSIAPGNSVLSTQIANVRVEQRGRGQAAEAQSMGWLSRFFLTLMPI